MRDIFFRPDQLNVETICKIGEKKKIESNKFLLL